MQLCMVQVLLYSSKSTYLLYFTYLFTIAICFHSNFKYWSFIAKYCCNAKFGDSTECDVLGLSLYMSMNYHEPEYFSISTG